MSHFGTLTQVYNVAAIRHPHWCSAPLANMASKLTILLVCQLAIVFVAAQSPYPYYPYYYYNPSPPPSSSSSATNKPYGSAPASPSTNTYVPAAAAKPQPSTYYSAYNAYSGPQVYYNQPQYQPPAVNNLYGSYYPTVNYNPYDTTNCTDQTCKSSECCEFNGKRYVCVPQEQTDATSTIRATGAICFRPKRCYNNGDCPNGHCCVVRLDYPIDIVNNNANANYYGSYNSGNYNNYGNYKTERGECILAVATTATSQVCRRPVDGSQTNTCPCASPRVCSFTGSNPLTGICA
ncbi:hypothetical protein Btru_061937 [Bulinus truncatus]|nr:hypothetical protein Btru_061937 [Bulinus truncatus]